MAETLNPALRDRLQEERDRLHDQLRQMGVGPGGRLDFDDGFADSGQVTAERGEVEALGGTLLDTLREIEDALSKFDARLRTSMEWNKTEDPINSAIDVLIGAGLNATVNNTARFQSTLVKPLPTGGVAGITFRTDYQLLSMPPAGVTNPAYRPFVQLQFDQPPVGPKARRA